MSQLEKHSFAERLARGCDGCGRNYLKVRALATATVEVLDGEPVSPPAWTYAPGELHARVYQIECAECRRVLHDDDACPLCRAPGGRSRALSAQHGLQPPAACVHCSFNQLIWTVESRLRVETILGRISRRVAEAEWHEAGFHVVEVRCRSCEALVAKSGDGGCAGCGRSRLLRRMS